MEFRSERAQYCVNCEETRDEQQMENRRLYFRARNAAFKRLVKAHEREYERYLTEERTKRGRMPKSKAS